MKSDNQIQQDVMDQLKYELVLNSSEIGVAVKNGIVTLSGMVDSFYKKAAAEKTVKKVSGVKAVAEDIQVGPSLASGKTGTEIAEAVLNALKMDERVPDDKIKIKVEDGNVTLEGEMYWEYQRIAARNAINHLPGVHMIYNQITLNPLIEPENVKQKIAAALSRSATIDARKVIVEVHGSKVTLKGSVRSFAEKEDAESAAWSSTGVTAVDNRLQLDVLEFAY